MIHAAQLAGANIPLATTAQRSPSYQILLGRATIQPFLSSPKRKRDSTIDK